MLHGCAENDVMLKHACMLDNLKGANFCLNPVCIMIIYYYIIQ